VDRIERERETIKVLVSEWKWWIGSEVGMITCLKIANKCVTDMIFYFYILKIFLKKIIFFIFILN
jgi:hypothetical protein